MLDRPGPAPTPTRHAKQLRDPAPAPRCTANGCANGRGNASPLLSWPWPWLPGNPTDLYAFDPSEFPLVNARPSRPGPNPHTPAKQLRDPAPRTTNRAIPCGRPSDPTTVPMRTPCTPWLAPSPPREGIHTIPSGVPSLCKAAESGALFGDHSYSPRLLIVGPREFFAALFPFLSLFPGPPG
jgi:hypothetical protein